MSCSFFTGIMKTINGLTGQFDTLSLCILFATRLLIFAQILVSSYDETEQVFLPFQMLSDKKKNILVHELEETINKSIEQMKNVNTKTVFWTSTRKANIAQNILDNILTITYPYISDVRGWTTMKTVLTEETSLKIKVTPKYVPYGEEDAADVTIAVRESNGEQARILIKG